MQGVDAVERGVEVAEQRPLRAGVEAGGLRREEHDRVSTVRGDELPRLDAQARLRAAQPLEEPPEAPERVGGRDLLEERGRRQREVEAQLASLRAEPRVRDERRDLLLRPVGQEVEAPWEVRLVDLARQLRIGPVPEPRERRVAAQRFGERAPACDRARLVGRADREDHRARELGIAEEAREERGVVARRVGQEVRNVRAEVEPRRDVGEHRRGGDRERERRADRPGHGVPGGAAPKSASISAGV